jgi:hypothetical protein
MMLGRVRAVGTASNRRSGSENSVASIIPPALRYSAVQPRRRRYAVVDGKLLGRHQPDHLDEDDLWAKVVGALPNLAITPFEAKALYVFPLMRQFGEGVITLLRRPEGSLDLPAFVLLADGIEALGRCLTGCQEEKYGSGPRLREGLEQLERRDDGEFRTMSGLYTVEDCTKLRNFTTHGGTTPLTLMVLDGHLTAMLLSRYGEELTDYWTRLGDETNVDERERFAAARIRPLATANRPVFIEGMFRMMTEPNAKAGQGIHL